MKSTTQFQMTHFLRPIMMVALLLALLLGVAGAAGAAGTNYVLDGIVNSADEDSTITQHFTGELMPNTSIYAYYLRGSSVPLSAEDTLTLNNGAVLMIEDGKTLDVSGTVTINGGSSLSGDRSATTATLKLNDAKLNIVDGSLKNDLCVEMSGKSKITNKSSIFLYKSLTASGDSTIITDNGASFATGSSLTLSGNANVIDLNTNESKKPYFGSSLAISDSAFIASKLPPQSTPGGTYNSSYISHNSVVGLLFAHKDFLLSNLPTETLFGEKGQFTWYNLSTLEGQSVAKLDTRSISKGDTLYAKVTPVDYTWDPVTGALTILTNDGLTDDDKKWNAAASGITAADVKHLIIGVTVTSAPNNAFEGCTALTSVVLPDKNFSGISDSMFKGCTALTSIDLSKNITMVDVSAFEGCTALATVKLNQNIKIIYSSVFKGCTSLTTIDLSDVTTLNASAFEGCTALTNVMLGYNITAIPNSTFKNCTALNTINLDGISSTIGANAFENCTSLTSIDVSGADGGIEESAFTGCKSITSVKMPGDKQIIAVAYPIANGTVAMRPTSTTKLDIEAYPYKGCDFGYWASNGEGGQITDVNEIATFYTVGTASSQTLTAIFLGDLDYDWDSDESTLTILTNKGTTAWKDDEDDTSIKTKVETLIIGNGVTEIANEAFKGCSKLSSIQFGAGVQSIGDEAFYSCPITSLNIPDNVTSIGDDTFANCTNMTSMMIGKGVISIGARVRFLWHYQADHS